MLGNLFIINHFLVTVNSKGNAGRYIRILVFNSKCYQKLLLALPFDTIGQIFGFVKRKNKIGCLKRKGTFDLFNFPEPEMRTM